MEQTELKRCIICNYKLVDDKCISLYCPNYRIPVLPLESKIVAKRNRVNYRYDVIDQDFLHCMAEIGAYGAETYGEGNWHKSRLDGEKGPVNHMYKHLGQYRNGEGYDHLDGDRKYHLAAIAFNAMMEFWYLENRDKMEDKK